VAIFGVCRVLKVLRVPEPVQLEGFNNAFISFKGFESQGMQVIPNHGQPNNPDDVPRGGEQEMEMAGKMMEENQGALGRTVGA
jgi:hypothetical protein